MSADKEEQLTDPKVNPAAETKQGRTPREIMDEQQDLIQRLAQLYANIKKVSLDRRTLERKERYNQQRVKLWEAIQDNHPNLISAGAPTAYEKHYHDADIISSKALARLNTWQYRGLEPPSVETSDYEESMAAGGEKLDSATGGQNTKGGQDPNLQGCDDSQKAGGTLKGYFESPSNSGGQNSNPQGYDDSQNSGGSLKDYYEFPSNKGGQGKPLGPTSKRGSAEKDASTIKKVQSHNSSDSEGTDDYSHPPQRHRKPSLTKKKVIKGDNESDDSSCDIPMPEIQKKPWSSLVEEETQSDPFQLAKILRLLTESHVNGRARKPLIADLKEFDGDVKKYRAFKDSFKRVIRQHDEVDEAELFLFLQSKLKGEALALISNLAVNAQSYVLAWRMLDKHYNNKRILLESTIHMFFDPETTTREKDPASQLDFITRLQVILANIDQLKATTHDIIMELALGRLDVDTKGRFEDYIGRSTTTPTFTQLFNFFDKERSIWRGQDFQLKTPLVRSAQCGMDQQRSKNKETKKSRAFSTQSSDQQNIRTLVCFLCKKPHKVAECDIFLSSNNRVELMKQHKLCIYCSEHKYDRKNRCHKYKKLVCDSCDGHHITLLHPLEQSAVLHTATSDGSTCQSILPTAIAKFVDGTGQIVQLRCLIDLCAERSYVTQDIVQKLSLKTTKASLSICGIDGLQGKASSTASITIKLDDFKQTSITTNAIVVPKVTGSLPSAKIVKLDFGEEVEVELADPNYHRPGFIGVLLGVDVATKLFKQQESNILMENGTILLQPTHLGWIVSGHSTKASGVVSTFVTLNESFEKSMQDKELAQRILKFYELPELVDEVGDDKEYCEALFKEKHYRLADGRYVVPTPWKVDSPELGHSYRKALQMFLHQEKKWQKNGEHYAMSNEFMSKYEQLGHMTRIERKDERKDSGEVYYIPYLSVLRKQALTTKLRNVFNASTPSSNGISLNQTMHEGPKLQTNIRDVILTARSYPYIYSSDISMMFRQIALLPEDRDKHRIIWRQSPDQPPAEYRLNTVTYGTDAAPFLAIRTIHQCADDNAQSDIADIIKRSFYVDDLLHGSDSIAEAQQQISNIITCLQSGQLPLTKWMSNSEEVLSFIPPENRITSYLADNCTTTKLLGLVYNHQGDTFNIALKNPENIKFTKRGISSVAASFFDPLGLILPFVMSLRIFLQKVWKQHVEWDDKLQEEIQSQFKMCIQGISKLNTISISRYVPSSDENTLELIGFADASNLAQAAVIYSRVKTQAGYRVTLLMAKGNVTKLKTKEVIDSKQCTIPKLELEALVTLADLYQIAKNCLGHRNLIFTAYTDSKVALAWVRSNNATKLAKMVERRVTKIRTVFMPQQLHYVKSEENPADPASRGLTAEQLSSCPLWFLGPTWLQHEQLPHTAYKDEEEFDGQDGIKTLTTRMYKLEEGMLDGISSWPKAIRVIAYCLRWKHRKGDNNKFITAEEISRATSKMISYYQHLHCGYAIEHIKNGKPIPKGHWLRSLTPFLDENNVLRVGGRLQNATFLSNTQRHPIIIPRSHCRQLLLDHTHKANGHASNSLMLRILVEEYWIAGIKQIIQQTIRHCTTCIRWRASNIQPEMSQLPAIRVTPSCTFDNIGVDLSGPYIIKASPLRNDKKMKIWVVNFVCMSTKAVHLEIVSDLSAEGFLAAFSRFCSRRGTCKEVWSDNGTNFVGANRMLKDTWSSIVRRSEEMTTMQQVRWKFIPRHSPTFGGLWEASVKTLKFFVKRMMGIQNLTYEEFTTLLCKIESLMNSRPLFANPLDPCDDPALTPFHFINQKGLKPSAAETHDMPLTKKWLAIKQLQQQFWERFRIEYLRELQAKTKWQVPQRNLAVNDVVLIKEPSSTPGDWKLGKVTKSYPDPAGIVRKVDVSNAKKEVKMHAVNQLVPLLHAENIEDNSKVIHEGNHHEQEEKQPTSKQAASSLQVEDKIDTTEPVQPRRTSPRLKKISLVHLCLVVLTLCAPTYSSIENLYEGPNIRFLNKVYLKSFDINFAVKTSLNMTHDTLLITNTANDFRQECMKLSQQSQRAHAQCSSLEKSISQLATQVINEIHDGYRERPKRWLGLTSKGIWKAAPAIATTLGMVYQEKQIFHLESQLVDLKQKMQKTVSILLNVTDLEYKNVENTLNQVIDKQQMFFNYFLFNDFFNYECREILCDCSS